jgi:serine/threonine-protein kinase
LGVVLYEMLSGRLPFHGDYEQAVIYSILNDEPEPLAEADRGFPPALAEALAHCLEKSPNDRVQSAGDLIQALRVIKPENVDAKATGSTASRRSLRALGLSLLGIVAFVTAGLLILRLKPTKPSAQVTRPLKIVVLPFENLGAPEDAYFAAGMADEITSRLANVQGLGVISRTSSTVYDRKGKTVKQIGNDLGVDYVLEGSVRWERGSGRESRVRITPQLIRVADDTNIWSVRYERILADVFAIQSDVAESAVKAMNVTILPREQTALKEVSTNDLEAYDLYLRGKEMEGRGNAKADTEGALQMYQAAVAHDPRFAQAFAGVAKMNLLMHWEYYDRSQERLAKAKEAAERAVELRPDLTETHNALGFYYYWGMLNYPQALDQFAAALTIKPSSAEALEGIGFVLRRQGKWNESVEKLSKATELDPKNANRLFNFGFSCVLAARYAAAEDAYARTLTLNSHWAEVHSERSWLQLLWHGDADKAQAILEEASRVAGLTDDAGYFTEIQFRIALARRDYQGELRRLQAEARDALDHQDRYWPIPLLIGQVHRLAGQHDLAVRSFAAARLELEQRVRQHPDDHRLHSSLGIAYAGLGRKDDAVREARRGCELMPPYKDAMRAIQRVEDLAVVYTMVSRKSDAIAALDDLLSSSGRFTAFVLRLDSRWDPLRGDPRFQSLLKKSNF